MSRVDGDLLSSSDQVVRALLTYTDWWQPSTTSVLQVARRSSEHPGIREGLLDTLDERSELCRRMEDLRESDRQLLVLWYVRQVSVDDIADALDISRRQCFRRRARAVRRIVELGESDRAA